MFVLIYINKDHWDERIYYIKINHAFLFLKKSSNRTIMPEKKRFSQMDSPTCKCVLCNVKTV